MSLNLLRFFFFYKQFLCLIYFEFRSSVMSGTSTINLIAYLWIRTCWLFSGFWGFFFFVANRKGWRTFDIFHVRRLSVPLTFVPQTTRRSGLITDDIPMIKHETRSVRVVCLVRSNCVTAYLWFVGGSDVVVNKLTGTRPRFSTRGA